MAAIINRAYPRLLGWSTAIAVVRIAAGEVEAALLPCWIDDEARPMPVGRSPRGEQVAAYLRAITEQAGFDTELAWADERLVARMKED